MKRVRGRAAVRGWIRERLDDLQLLDDGAWPAMRNDDRQRILMLRTNMNEMDVEAVDLGDELWDCTQSRFELAPVVVGAPIPRQRLHRRQLHTLRCIVDRFTFWPPCLDDAPSQIG